MKRILNWFLDHLKLVFTILVFGITFLVIGLVMLTSYTSYQRYEKNLDGTSKKIQNLIKLLDDSFSISEVKGILTIDQIRKIIVPILQKHQINKCYLFGSYVRNEAREDSDVDLLLDTDITGLDFFALVEELRIALHKKVDVLRLKDISDNNPISLIILKEGVLLYGNN